jgi:hypothetical protein
MADHMSKRLIPRTSRGKLAVVPEAPGTPGKTMGEKRCSRLESTARSGRPRTPIQACRGQTTGAVRQRGVCVINV